MGFHLNQKQRFSGESEQPIYEFMYATTKLEKKTNVRGLRVKGTAEDLA